LLVYILCELFTSSAGHPDAIIRQKILATKTTKKLKQDLKDELKDELKNLQRRFSPGR
jgi:hypothetical protein